MKYFKIKSSKILKRSMLALALVFCIISPSFAQSGLSMGSSQGSNSTQSLFAPGTGGMNMMRFPLIVGGSFGLGSGAGVGDGHGVGLCQIRPILGVWVPGIAFLRLGYGFSSYEETNDENEKDEVEHSEFNVEIGTHLLSEFYLTGSYSRVNALSENGDVSWNEWSFGFGTFWSVFPRTNLTLDIGYHWVLEHYDPFLEKKISGGRMQINVGFAVYVY